MSRHSLNLNTVSFEAFCGIIALDETYVGTPSYLGVAYFWGQEGKHAMRDASYAQRRRIHKKFIEENLELTGGTDRHLQIIAEVTQ